MGIYSAEQVGPNGHDASRFVLRENHHLVIGLKHAEAFVGALRSGLPGTLDLGEELPRFVAFGSENIKSIYKRTVSVEGELLQTDPAEARLTFFKSGLFKRGVAALLGREVEVSARVSVVDP